MAETRVTGETVEVVDGRTTGSVRGGGIRMPVLLRKLKKAQDGVLDLREFWAKRFMPSYAEEVQDTFAVEGLQRNAAGRFRSGTKWQALSPAYRAWKRRHYPGKRILQRTGALKKSLTWRKGGAGRPGDGGIFRATKTSMEFGTSVPYAKYHQFGAPGANLPARPFLHTPDRHKYQRMLRDYVNEMVQKALGRKVSARR